MSDSIAVRAVGLGKCYRIGRRIERYQTLGDAIIDCVSRPFRKIGWIQGCKSRTDSSYDTKANSIIWALRDVSFEVKQGEVIGIIGRNGAGKSTLLKILSRITEPTIGHVTLCGRVGSLLEVGTGFHPELTGRENIYLYGAILGMRKREIERKFDQIVAFAEVEKFIDTPVKRYSSGMYVRLAFAVAAHLEPEILLVDEVLAVGDLAFQGKCLAYMKNLSRHGTTILFVSHNLLTISDFCNRSLLVSNGSIVLDGDTAAVVSRYRRLLAISKVDSASQSEYLHLVSLRLNGTEAQATISYPSSSPLLFELELQVMRPIHSGILNLVIELPDGRYVVHLRSDISGTPYNLDMGRHLLTVRLANFSVSSGMYLLWFRMVSTHPESSIMWDTEKTMLEVEGFNPLGGIIWPEHSFDHQCLEELGYEKEKA